MNKEELEAFLHDITYCDFPMKLYGKIYCCLGLARYPDNKYHIQVYEEKLGSREFTRKLLDYASDSREDCMQHFLYDKYWDGKSFFEIAPDMEWV